MLTKRALTLLTIGGVVVAERTVPFPRRYVVRLIGEPDVDLTEDDVLGLLKSRTIAPPHASEIGLGDLFTYHLIDEAGVRRQVVQDFTVGFGRCAVCGEVPLALTSKGRLPRHGHTKAGAPACAGSGQVPALLVLRDTGSDQVLVPTKAVA